MAAAVAKPLEHHKNVFLTLSLKMLSVNKMRIFEMKDRHATQRNKVKMFQQLLKTNCHI